MAITELTCREFVELITDYLEGALIPVEAARVASHLGSCRPCTLYLDQMQRTIAAADRSTKSSDSLVRPNELLQRVKDLAAVNRDDDTERDEA
jgi:predicted anti-sigma-YlaC factor YlaD